jgi:hypothetical protein
MHLSNEIVLRPRFKFIVDQDNEFLLDLFEKTKSTQSEYIVTRIDDHVFIKFPKQKQQFWSPQLHLEINKNENDKSSTIYGLFGPSPTVWTMFMFFHFIVIGLFLGFGVWTYTNWSLDNEYSLQLFTTLFMIVVWCVLYFSGSIGKKSGMDEMHSLHHFMRDTLRSHNIHSEE